MHWQAADRYCRCRTGLKAAGSLPPRVIWCIETGTGQREIFCGRRSLHCFDTVRWQEGPLKSLTFWRYTNQIIIIIIIIITTRIYLQRFSFRRSIPTRTDSGKEDWQLEVLVVSWHAYTHLSCSHARPPPASRVTHTGWHGWDRHALNEDSTWSPLRSHPTPPDRASALPNSITVTTAGWVSSFLTAHQHIIGYSVPWKGALLLGTGMHQSSANVIHGT